MLPKGLIQINMLGRSISVCRYSNVPHHVMEVKYSDVLGLLHQSDNGFVVSSLYFIKEKFVGYR
jgi:hypothetical protein